MCMKYRENILFSSYYLDRTNTIFSIFHTQTQNTPDFFVAEHSVLRNTTGTGTDWWSKDLGSVYFRSTVHIYTFYAKAILPMLRSRIILMRSRRGKKDAVLVLTSFLWLIQYSAKFKIRLL
jgi:hypothetical protein